MTPEGLSAADVIATFGLEPLPVEGGLYRRWYCASDVLRADAVSTNDTRADDTRADDMPADDMRADKPAGTAIVAMITDEQQSFSALHQLKTDELWHFYVGDPLVLVLLEPGGTSRRVVLGHDIGVGQVPFAVAPRGCWFGADLAPGGSFAVFGCTMAPGFTPDDFRGGVLDELLAGWPHEADAIHRLHRVGEPLFMPGAVDDPQPPA